MPKQSYFDAPGWSRSQLAVFDESRQKFYDTFIATDDVDEDTECEFELDHFTKGTNLHLITLEPDEFYSRLELIPPSVLTAAGRRPNRKGCRWKDWLEEIPEDAIPLKQSELEELEAMRDSVMRTDISHAIQHPDTLIEQPIFWDFEARNGITLHLKCELDVLLPSAGLLCDLKSTKDASYSGFKSATREFRYWLQDAHYTMGVTMGSFCDVPPQFLFCAVQKSDGYPAELYELSRQDRSAAARRHEELLHDLALCIETDDWTEPQKSNVKTLYLGL